MKCIVFISVCTCFLAIFTALLVAQGPESCNTDEFFCPLMEECLSNELKCDGIVDCDLTDELDCPEPGGCAQGDVRPLLGGASQRDGLLEVCIDDFYLPVDLRSFTIKEANVVCRQLELGTAGFPISSEVRIDIEERFSEPRLVSIECDSGSSRLSQCELTTTTSSTDDSTSQLQQAGVQCIDVSSPLCMDGDIRLSDSPRAREGRVEICYQGVWGAVYDEDWSALDAAVVCRQLGFAARGALPIISAIFRTNARDLFPLPIVYDSPVCGADNELEDSLLDCTREDDGGGILDIGELSGGVRYGTASFSRIVGVRCDVYPPTGCSPRDIQLSYRGRGGSSGQLEVCNDSGEWSTVCDSGSFTQLDADVVCQQLGFTFEDGNQPTPNLFSTCAPPDLDSSSTLNMPILDGLNCMGSGGEDLLSSMCNYSVISPPTPTCNHQNDVSILCRDSPQIIFDIPPFDESFEFERGRDYQIKCRTDPISYPPVANLRVERVGGRKKRSSRRPSIGDIPEIELLGPDDRNIEFITIRCCAEFNVSDGPLPVNCRDANLIVQLFEGPPPSTSFLRFSLSQFISNFPSTNELSRVVLRTINPNVPGFQIITCEEVSSRLIEMERNLSRFQCMIEQRLNDVEDSDQITAFRLTEGLARTIGRLERQIVFTNASDTGFCDFDTTFSSNNTILNWPETVAGTNVSQRCPPQINRNSQIVFIDSLVYRECGVEQNWLDPDFSQCRLVEDELAVLLQENVTVDNLDVQFDSLASSLLVTENDTLQQTTDNLQLVSQFFIEVENLVGENITISNQVIISAVESVDSLLQWDPDILLNTLPQSSPSSSIVQSFETITAAFAQQTDGEELVILNDLSLLIERDLLDTFQQSGRGVTVLDGNVTSGNSSNTGSQLSSSEFATISLPPSLFDTANSSLNQNAVGLVFTSYQTTSLFPVRTSSQDAAATTRRTVVGSVVIAATVGSGIVFNDLTDPVQYTLRMAISSEDLQVPGSQPTCVFWDFTLDSGRGNWSSEGCTAVTSDTDTVTCECSHLTNFAILVDVCSRTTPADCNTDTTVNTILSFITYIGVAISMVGLVLTVITFLIFKKLRGRDAGKYHIQLCIAIFCMLLVFVVGVEQTGNYGGCVTVSVLIHYFTLVAVMWMGAEALLMFEKFIFVFHHITVKEIITVSVVCWSVPLLPVLIPLIIDLAMGNDSTSDLIIQRDQYCFLSHVAVFWAAFLGPILLLIVFNIIIFCVVIFVLIRHTKRSALGMKPDQGMKPKTILRLTISIMGIMFLFGLSWVFAALTISTREVQITFQVLFTVFNSLQGFFIFLFLCVFNKDARKLWKELLCCGRYVSEHLHPSQGKYTGSANASKLRKNKQQQQPSNTESIALSSKNEPDTLSEVALEKDAEVNEDKFLRYGETKKSEDSKEDLSKDSQAGKDRKQKEGRSLKAIIKRYSTRKERKHHIEEHRVNFTGSSSEED